MMTEEWMRDVHEKGITLSIGQWVDEHLDTIVSRAEEQAIPILYLDDPLITRSLERAGIHPAIAEAAKYDLPSRIAYFANQKGYTVSKKKRRGQEVYVVERS